MFWKSLLLLYYVLSDIEGLSSEIGISCLPHLDHGRFKVRLRQKGKLFKFMCFPGYRLVGSRYITCREDVWDAPLPVCVRTGCPQIPPISNGIKMPSHNGAWVVFFCYPDHKLVGSPAIYCDGRKWNGSIPVCVNSNEAGSLACNFEDANLCGWTQDELHDFDWKRLNKKTPSSFLFTGPPYDHTYGVNGNGYYMYIESTSRLENDTARLISPLYSSSLSKNGCFSFYYHMFGKTTGGLRVYQKPSTVPMENLHEMTDDGGQRYLLFEKWGNQGDVWYSGVSGLEESEDDFQIVIEGIRGKSFTSDIAIDDVSILQGDNCTAAREMASTPAVVMPDSCAGRCDVEGTLSGTDLDCGCSTVCVVTENCCPDFFDRCVFESTTPEESPVELPQTQKLILTTDGSTSPTMRAKPVGHNSTPTYTTMTITSTKVSSIKTTGYPTTSSTTRPKLNPTTKSKTIKPTTPIPTTKIIPISTTTKVLSTLPVVKPTTSKPAQKARYTSSSTSTEGNWDMLSVQEIEDTTKTVSYKKKEKQTFEVKTMTKEYKQSDTSGLKTTAIVITGLLLCVGAVLVLLWGRGAGGRPVIAWLQGRVRNDPEVQYLHSAADDD